MKKNVSTQELDAFYVIWVFSPVNKRPVPFKALIGSAPLYLVRRPSFPLLSCVSLPTLVLRPIFRRRQRFTPEERGGYDVSTAVFHPHSTLASGGGGTQIASEPLHIYPSPPSGIFFSEASN